ncbi:MAG: peptidyl-prolyl cis-trans isomerase [Mycobacterium sp.]|jgi:peptidyl-prolyl cis-trans isomerase B (cyclophilin B)|nr:peptidyl-prolyl cis-trans isomerase [Mycobacterium sp.]
MPPGPMPGPPGYPPYPPPPPPNTNGLAIASLVCAFLFFPLGIVFGHMSLSQIRKKHEGGHGLAIAGLVISYVAAVLTVLAVLLTVVFAAFLARFAEDFDPNRSYSGSPNTTGSPLPSQPLPTFKPKATLGANCQYPATTEATSKPVNPPRTGKVPTTPATVHATIVTNDGVIGVQLDNGKSPCTVNNFVSLAQQGFFDKTPCHRLTTSSTLGVLQCGDPTGDGTGGPGYRFPNEYPTNQYRLADPGLETPVTYPRGTLAMANAGQGTNGSQFFLVYEDSQLPPTYTVFGTIDETGLAVVDKIAARGVADGSEDGKPATKVEIESVRLD